MRFWHASSSSRSIQLRLSEQYLSCSGGYFTARRRYIGSIAIEAPMTSATNNSELVFTPAARRAQAERGSAAIYAQKVEAGYPDSVTPELAAFIAEQDTAFLGTASADGAPYIQHRGGPKGFIKVVDERTLGFADYRGNRQYITLGNLSENDRAYLFLIDFSRRQRIKLWGRARVVENDDALIERLFDHGYKAKPERVILFTIEAWNANCSQHITARLSEPEIEQMLGTVQERYAALQAENTRLRALLAGREAVSASQSPAE